jgi:hypothetical protein
MLSLRVDVERAGMVDVVRVAVMLTLEVVVVDEDEAGPRDRRQEEQREVLVLVLAEVATEMAGTHVVARGRTRTRRDRRIMTGNEDATRNWPRREEDQVVDNKQKNESFLYTNIYI